MPWHDVNEWTGKILLKNWWEKVKDNFSFLKTSTEKNASDIGNTAALETKEKTSVVDAINDILDNGTNINNGSGFAGGRDATASEGGAVGCDAEATGGGAVGYHASSGQGFAGGQSAMTYMGGAVGYCAMTHSGFAGGKSARTAVVQDGRYVPIDAVQLGSGTNGEERTMQVYSYKLMNRDGTIPDERIPQIAAETEARKQKDNEFTSQISDLSARITAEEQSRKTKDNELISEIGALSDLATTDKSSSVSAINEVQAETNSIADNTTVIAHEYGGFAAGRGAAVQQDNSSGSPIAIGMSAVAKYYGIAVGVSAKSTGAGMAMGQGAECDGSGFAAGYGAKTGHGIAIGDQAKTVDANGKGIDAVQLGKGTNNTPKTMQVYDKRIVEADGILTDVGNLSDLNTADKSSIVCALNEVNDITTTNEEELERLQYYGDKNIVPAAQSKFTWEVSDDGFATVKSYLGEDTSLVIPYEYIDDRGASHKVTAIGTQSIYDDGIFFGCENLTNVIIPGSVTDIGANTFAGCPNLTKVVIPESVTVIGQDAFGWCTSLTNVAIPSSVTIINISTFETCLSLTNIVIPNSVTRIDNLAFKNTNLTNVVIPNSVTAIGEEAFAECSDLKTIVIPGSVTAIAESAFNNCDNLIIICEQGSYAETYAKENNKPYMYDVVNKVTISASAQTASELEMAHNTEIRYGEMTSLTITLPETLPDDYISSVVFTSGETAVNMVYPETVKMSGEGCIDGVFVPAANKRYTVILSYDGVYVSGIVGGVGI